MGFIACSFTFFRRTVSPLHALAASFIRMVGRVPVLTPERVLTKMARADAEVEALRYQINPHLVSNSLNLICPMAHGSGATSTARMTGSLIRIVSDSLRAGEREVTLQRERENFERCGFLVENAPGVGTAATLHLPPLRGASS